MKKVFLSICFLFAGLSAQSDLSGYPHAWFWPKPMDPFTGKAMPTLNLVDSKGLPFHRPKGSILVLDFSCAWCSYCRERVMKNNALFRKYSGRGVVMVGILVSSNAEEEIDNWARSHKMQYPAVRDPHRENLRHWDASYFPTYTVVDAQGVIRASGLRPEFAESFLDEYLRSQPGRLSAADAVPSENAPGRR